MSRPGHDADGWRQLADGIASPAGLAEFLHAVGVAGSERLERSLAVNDAAALSAAARGSAGWWPSATDIRAPSLWYLGEAEGGFGESESAHAAANGIETHVVAGADHATAFISSGTVCEFVLPFLAGTR